jgi:hypothetical protein
MNWLNEKRITVYSWAFVVLYIVITSFWYFAGNGITDLKMKPVGSDYICFYAASDLVLDGKANDVYNIYKIYEREVEVIGNNTYMVGWYYPPTFLLPILPLSLMPYLLSLIIWLGISIFLYITVLKRIVPHNITLGVLLASPATFQNIIHGQNGFFTAAIAGWGLILIQEQPVLGGVILGLLSFKPHLAFLIFLALAAGRHWKAFFSAAASAAAFAAASIIAFGISPWFAFIKQLPFVASVVEEGYLPWDKMSSIFAASRLLGLDIQISYIIQAIVTLGVIMLVIFVWHKKAPFPIKASILISGIFLVTHYSFQYDLAILALAIGWYGWEAYKTGWKPYEKLVLLLMWLMPLLNSFVAKVAKVQIVPFIIIAFLIIAVRRLLQVREGIEIREG